MLIFISDKSTEECHWKFVKRRSKFTVSFVEERKQADFTIIYTSNPKNAYMRSEFLRNGLKNINSYEKNLY